MASVKAAFVNFPGEIRNKIYSHVIESGDLSLFATSKQIREEGLPRLFRLYFDYTETRQRLPEAELSATKLIQNLELQMNFCGDPGPGSENAYRINYFRGREFTRESCTIILDCGEPGLLSYTLPEFEPLQKLTSFKLLTAKFSYTPYSGDEWDPAYHRIGWDKKRDREAVMKALKEKLGPADTVEMGEDEPLRYNPLDIDNDMYAFDMRSMNLVFHPVDFATKRNQQSLLAPTETDAVEECDKASDFFTTGDFL